MFGGDENRPNIAARRTGRGAICLVHLAAYYFIISDDSSVTSQLLVSVSNEIALKNFSDFRRNLDH
jgi:hypothetical protein